LQICPEPAQKQHIKSSHERKENKRKQQKEHHVHHDKNETKILNINSFHVRKSVFSDWYYSLQLSDAMMNKNSKNTNTQELQYY